MLVAEGPAGLPAAARGAAVALGNFDGLHAGHRAVIDAARQLADAAGAPLGVASFEPAPRRFFQPDAPPFRILTPVRRELGLRRLGVETCVLLRFDAAMAAMSERDFVEQALARDLGVAGVAVGFDFRYGHDREGDGETLKRHGARLGFPVAVTPRVDAADGAKASSTAIRAAIAAGDMAAAAELLGGWWTVDGVVEHGEKRGRTLGFPTANLRLGELIAPPHGVYAVFARPDDEPDWRPGVASFGRTPTTGLRDPLLEAALFGFSGDLYGRRLHVAFAAFLREERRFASLEALVTQMRADAAEAAARLERSRPPAGP